MTTNHIENLRPVLESGLDALCIKLTKEQQEMSILISCSLVKAKVFIPPFNKWNIFTENICKEHDIDLVKFEDGWKCMEYNKYNGEQKLWYLHHREFTLNTFKEWFK